MLLTVGLAAVMDRVLVRGQFIIVGETTTVNMVVIALPDGTGPGRIVGCCTLPLFPASQAVGDQE